LLYKVSKKYVGAWRIKTTQNSHHCESQAVCLFALFLVSLKIFTITSQGGEAKKMKYPKSCSPLLLAVPGQCWAELHNWKIPQFFLRMWVKIRRENLKGAKAD
jgi:hypothetical protein